MKTIKKVYIITSGEYSDYSISQVFLDKKEADAYCKVHNDHALYNENYIVEEYDVNNACYSVAPHWINIWRACSYKPIDKSRDFYVTEREVLETEYDAFFSSNMQPTPVEILTAKENDEKFDDIYFSVYSDESEEHAKKKLYDYTAKMKALWEGI